MVLGKLPVLGRPTIWITVGQGPIALAVGAVGQGPAALAVGAGGVVWTFLLSSILSLLFLSLGDGPIQAEILSQRAVKPKTTNQRPFETVFQSISGRLQERGRGEKRIDREKMSKQPAPAASAVGPCPTIIQIVGRPGTGSLEPSHHPTTPGKNRCCGCFQLGHLNDQLFWKELFICFTACVFVNV